MSKFWRIPQNFEEYLKIPNTLLIQLTLDIMDIFNIFDNGQY